MAWQNASACTVATSTPSGSRRQSSRVMARTVVACSLRLQYAAKSCSPTSPAAAALSRSRSSGRTQPSVSCRRSGSGPHGVSATRYSYRRNVAENRASNVGRHRRHGPDPRVRRQQRGQPPQQ